MISKRFSIFTILLALLLTFGHNSYSQGVSDDEIILGMHTDISGPVSSFGKYSVEGVQMRIDEINKAGGIHGRMLKIIAEDHQYQVPRAVQAANKLLNKDKIFLMGCKFRHFNEQRRVRSSRKKRYTKFISSIISKIND